MSVKQDDPRVYTTIKKLLDIPEDEPIFILRAQDKFSIEGLQSYRSHVLWGVRSRLQVLEEWGNEVGSIINDFKNWQRDHKEKIKVPD